MEIRLLGTAGVHATAEVPVAALEDPAGAVRERLANTTFESVADVAVCDGERLAGLVRLEWLLAAREDELIRDLMDPDPPVVGPGVDQEVAAWRMVEHGESSLAVVDGDGRFLGLIPPNRMLGVLLQEHDEDLARLAGVLHGTEAAREAGVEPVGRRLWHRLPWLLIGLVGSLVFAVVVDSFEDVISDQLLLAAFIPGVVYMSDAVGTQTEAVVIRALSVGVPVATMLWRELVTGIVIGAAIAAAFVPIGLLLWSEPAVILAVALALLAACSTATVVAMSLPYALWRLGRDPAFGSGPLATVVQDLLSVAIYLAIGALLV